MFSKIDRMYLLMELFPDADFVITFEVYNELLRAKEAGYDFVDDIFKYEFEVVHLNSRCKRNTKTVTVAKALAIAKLSHLSTDGTKTKAKASNNNLQITVDHDSGIIAANDVTPDCTDPVQLELPVNSTMESVGKLPESVEMRFDNGYFRAANLRYS